jgi:serine/threonine protein kinase/tetratricopeptide (TPR) repeat protein
VAPSEHGEQAIFDAARRIAAPEERRRYVHQSCGEDRDLRVRVEALLRIHDQDSTFLRSPAEVPPLAFEPPAGEAPGGVVGPYTLIEPIGEGGMGVVFRAEQARPVRRQVALKIVRPGMDTRQVLARFDAERQALARMDHPNIARVLDAGTTDRGLPYFVMELVQGVPVTRYCDDHKLTVPQRLELFLAVCQGVQHAHQKGVIHRDLKPSNVLVPLYDGKPVPTLIVFALAKATGPKLTDSTVITQLGFVIGTPEYMSPEQAEPNQLDIDTRSDVYSLGVLLYELLTGTTPLGRDRVKDGGILEFLRVIREEEPPRPSARLAGMAELPAVAAGRGLEPKRLVARVRGDLDWIAMKCLEKDRARRYETADGLARGVERHLRYEPVEASPPGAGYRLRKFVRRHRAALATAAAFALLVLGGAAVSTWQAVRATAERDDKEKARQAEAEQRAQAVAEKDRADEEAAVARAVEDFLRTDLLGQADIGNQDAPGERNRDITVRELLDRAAARIDDRFRGQERTEAAIRHTLGNAYRQLGEYPKALIHLERSLALRRQKLGADHPDTLETLNDLALLHRDRGRYDEARPLLERAVELRRARQGADHPATLTAMHNLGAIYRDLSRYDDAEALFTQVLAVRRATQGPDHPDTLLAMNNVALLHLSRGRFKEAEPLLKQVVAGFKAQLGPDHSFTLTCTNNLAGCYMELRRFDDAEPLFRQVLAVRRAKYGDDHPDTLFARNFVGLVLKARDHLTEAEPILREVLNARRRKLGADHPDTLTSVSNLAIVLNDLHKYDEAEVLFKQALAGRRAGLSRDDPDVFRSLNNLAGLYRDTGRYADAEPLYREAAVGAKKKLTLSHPQTWLYVNNLIETYGKLGKPALAEAELRGLADFARGRFGPDSSAYAGQLARLSQNLLGQKKYADAEAAARDCLAIRAAKEPDAWTTFNTRSLLGAALLGQKKYADAEPLLTQGYAGMKERVATIPDVARPRLTEALERLVQLHDARGNTAEADRLRSDLQKAKPKP